MKKVLLLAVFLLTAVCYADDYEVKLDRADKPGDRSSIDLFANQSMNLQVSANGQVIKQQNSQYTLKLTGVLSVTEVDDKNEASKILVKVTQCTKTEKGRGVPFLKEGDEVVVFRENGTTMILVNGQTAEDSVAKVLRDVLTVHESSKPTDDDIFGTKNRVKEGEEWPVDLKLAAADFQSKDITISEESMTGKAKLNRILEDQGTKCQEVTASVQVASIGLPVPGFKTEKSEMTLSFLGYFPLDLRKGKTYESVEMKIAIEGSANQPGSNGQTITTRLKMESSQSRTIHYKRL